MLYLGGLMLLFANAGVVAFVSSAGSGDPVLYVLNLGVAGIGLFLFVKGGLHSSSEVNSLLSQNEKLWQANKELTEALGNSAMPAILKSTEAVRQTAREDRGLTRQEALDLVSRIENLYGGGSG
jgi:hypothetical protein